MSSMLELVIYNKSAGYI